MDELEKEMWEAIYQEWVPLFKILKERLPINEYKMYTPDGQIVESNRPMVESIIADKQSKSRALVFYLVAAEIISLPEATHEVVGRTENGGRIIEIKGFSAMPLGIGGGSSTAKASVDRKS